MNSRRVRLFPVAYKYACPTAYSAVQRTGDIFFFFCFYSTDVPETLIESVLAVPAVSAARVHPDRIVSRRRRRSGIRQQRQSPSEQRDSQRNRSEQRPKRGHSRGTKGNGYPEIQVRISIYYHRRSFLGFPSQTFYFVFLRFNGSTKSRFAAYIFDNRTVKSKNCQFSPFLRICVFKSVRVQSIQSNGLKNFKEEIEKKF